MTPARGPFLGGVVACFAAAVLLAAAWGPSRRVYLPAPQVVPVATAGELLAWCEAQGLRGRRAVVLARHLVQAEDPRGDSAEVEALTALMHRAVIRELHHVVPDRAWTEVAWNLGTVSIYRTASAGRVANFEDGRVSATPLSGFWPAGEPVLLVLHPADWSAEELELIAGLVRSGRLRADLVALLRGTGADLALWRAIMSSIRV